MAPAVAGLGRPARTGRVRDAVLTWIVFMAGGFTLAVLAGMACGEAYLVWSTFWDGPLTGSILGALAMGAPLIAFFLFFYGCCFAAAYLGTALAFAASMAALSVWRSGRVPAGCIAGLLLVCPAIVFAQASVFGAWFDPFAESEADALTATKIFALFSPFLVPALVGAWLIVRRQQIRSGHHAGDGMRAP